LRISLQIPSDAMLVLFAGKFEPKKNPALLISAFLEAALKNAHLLMVGIVVLETSLKQLAGNASKIHFLPFQNQSKLPLFYHASDVFVLPSDGPGETWGLAVNEAMACGKPIIVSDKVGCAIDLVETGKNGWIFPHGNQPASVEVLRKLNNRELAKNMGHSSQQKIAHFSFTNIASSIEGCITKN
jgi:glycosyltransferase involved in cell wall biosynthesis